MVVSKYDFQAWLKTKVSDAPEVAVAGKLEYIKLYLSAVMRELRELAQVNQQELGGKLGLTQGTMSKLESAKREHSIESTLKYFEVLDADLLIAVKRNEAIYQVSDPEIALLVDVPPEVQNKAVAAGVTVRQYVHAALTLYDEALDESEKDE